MLLRGYKSQNQNFILLFSLQICLFLYWKITIFFCYEPKKSNTLPTRKILLLKLTEQPSILHGKPHIPFNINLTVSLSNLQLFIFTSHEVTTHNSLSPSSSSSSSSLSLLSFSLLPTRCPVSSPSPGHRGWVSDDPVKTKWVGLWNSAHILIWVGRGKTNQEEKERKKLNNGV